MALSLDAHVVGDLSAHISLALDFVGTIAPGATDVEQCHTSSGWSECVVNAFHLCAQEASQTAQAAAAAAAASGGSTGSTGSSWWRYSVCMFQRQYPPAGSTSRAYLECAGLNPVHPLLRNQSCTRAEFGGVVAGISAACAEEAGLAAEQVRQCATGAGGLALLKASMGRSSGFPKSLVLKVEPQWILVDGPESCSEAAGGWSACEGFFDKTSCQDWKHCASDDWAVHLRQRVCAQAGISPC
jgi:hypothetical protein